MGRLGRRRSAHRWFAAAVLAGTVAAIVVGPSPAARAQDGAEPAATVGSAKATAVLLKVAPTVGNLQLAVASGVSVAEIRNQLAQSQSQSLDLGLLGSTLTAEQCDGRPALLRPSDLPEPLRIDNRGGEASATDGAAPITSSLAAGLQQVRATPQPLAEAVSTGARVALGPLLDLAGGIATATTEVVDGGAARVAHASVGVDLEIPGILRLAALRWDAVHRTGTEPEARATFDLGTVEVLGIPLDLGALPLDAVADTVNALLGPLGLTIQLPTVERFTEPTDFVRITPLRLRFGDSPIGALLAAPLLDATRQLRDELAAALIAFYCRTSTAFLVSEIVLGQLAGTGSTVISIGGAEATTGLVPFEDPFGDGGLLPPPTTDTGGTGDGGPVSTTPRAVVPGPGPVARPPAALPPATPVRTQPIGDFERVCESVHPFAWPSCSAGAAPFVGIAAVAATAALGFLDWRHQRRRRQAATAPAAGGPV